MLLTSGQISMTISSCIVFIFTSLLFFSGYVLQQQTVRSLQAAIRPPAPATHSLPPSPDASSTPVARPFGKPSGSRSHTFSGSHLNITRPIGGWAKVAYIQLLRRHIHVCNAVMLFAELAHQKSPAQRVILYPSVWDGKNEQQGVLDSSIDTSVRLLRMAAQRFDVTLVPIGPIVDVGDDALETAYPIAGLFSLTNFNQVLYLPPSGLIIDTSMLDTFFSIPSSSSAITFPSASSNEQSTPPLLMIQPSMQSYHESISSVSSATYSEGEYLRSLPKFMPGISEDINQSIVGTSELHSKGGNFSSAALLATTSYVHFSDSNILGPEYDISREVFLRSSPLEAEPRKAWEDLYELYRTRRMDVCGLDLEPVAGAHMPNFGLDTKDEHRARTERKIVVAATST